MQNLKKTKIKEYITQELNPQSYQNQAYKAMQSNHQAIEELNGNNI